MPARAWARACLLYRVAPTTAHHADLRRIWRESSTLQSNLNQLTKRLYQLHAAGELQTSSAASALLKMHRYSPSMYRFVKLFRADLESGRWPQPKQPAGVLSSTATLIHRRGDRDLRFTLDLAHDELATIKSTAAAAAMPARAWARARLLTRTMPALQNPTQLYKVWRASSPLHNHFNALIERLNELHAGGQLCANSAASTLVEIHRYMPEVYKLLKRLQTEIEFF